MNRPTGLKVCLFLAILFAFGVRVYDLAGPSMWSDEGLSVYRARQSLATIAANVITVDGIETQDTNPPFYFFLLHGIRALAGESVFVLRYVGVLAGTLSIPVMYRLGVWAFSPQVGITAVWLLALSPFHVWQSQDMRNYSLLLLLNLASVAGLFQLLTKNDKRGLAVWMVASLLGVYTHYFGFFILAFGVLVLLFFNWQRVWRWLLVLGGLMLPILPIAWGRFVAGQQVDFVSVPVLYMVLHAFSAYSVGIVPGFLHPWWRVLPALLLVGGGVISKHRRLTAVIVGYLIIPLALLVLLSFINPLYNGPRHLLIGLPAFLLLLAVGIVKGRRVGWLLALAVVVSQALWLHTQFTAPELVKDDVKGLAAYLTAVTMPDDVVVLHDTLIGFVFDYYYDGEWVAVPASGQVNKKAGEVALQETAVDASRLWFVTEPTPRNGFPHQFLSRWVNERWPRLWGQRFPSLWLGVRLEAYAPQSMVPTLPNEALPVQVDWVDGLQLHGLEAKTTVKSGQDWWPNFYWQYEGDAGADYLLSVRFMTQGELWAQIDQPLWPQYPPTDWPAAQMIRQPHRVPLPAGLPPGVYEVWLRVLKDGQPLPTTTATVDRLLLPEMRVTPALTIDKAQLPSHTPIAVHWPDVALVGYQLDAVDYRPGHVVTLDAYWQVLADIDTSYEWVVQLVDAEEQLVAETLTSPSLATYPTTQWRRGELIRGQAHFVVPARAESGSYEVRMALRDQEQGEWIRRRWGQSPMFTVGSIFVVAWPLVTEMPPVSTPLVVTLGEPPFADLVGYDLPTTAVSPGTQLPLTLFWRALAATNINYRVFVHVTAMDETIVAQVDGVPVQGSRPTVSWRPGEVLVDAQMLMIGETVPPGRYRLWAGLYDGQLGERPLTVVDGVVMADGRVWLGDLQIIEE